MRYASVCSGIEAATAAWHPLGWKPAWFSEIEPFPSAVLAHHYPDTPNLGDMTKINVKDYRGTIDILVGGTPCQSFSVAGLRKGLADPRGNLALEFLRLADGLGARWVVWENVPGVLSSNEGRDFGAFLGGLEELGYRCVYRVLDAQYFGVPQRRRRVFVVGYFGDWRPAAAVLLEPESLRGDSPPIREAREEIAGTIGTSSHDSSRDNIGEALTVTHALTAEGFDASEDGTGRGTPLVPACGIDLYNADESGRVAHTLRVATDGGKQSTPHVYAVSENQRGEVRLSDVSASLGRGGGKPGQGYPSALSEMGVRRLTPRECERLQGFPDDYTLIQVRGKPAADGPRYKACGNSMAVPVMAWIGRRIELVEQLRRRSASE